MELAMSENKHLPTGTLISEGTSGPPVVAWLTTAHRKDDPVPHHALNYTEANAKNQHAHWIDRGCEVKTIGLVDGAELSELQAQIDTLQTELAAVREQLRQAQSRAARNLRSLERKHKLMDEDAATIDELRAELQRVKADARRYQWLRDKSEGIHPFYMSTPIWFTGVAFKKESVDSAIDAAIDAGGGEAG
jgi:predicted RNase H-like nuclease (RuvC/YqgF family)